MSQAKLDELKTDLAELSKLSSLAERQRIKNIFLIETRKLETEIANINDLLKQQGTTIDSVPKKPRPEVTNKCYDVKLTNYAWDQSDNFVKIFVTLNDVHTIPEENVHCQFTNTSVEMVAKALANRNYTFTMKNLLENIDVANSKWKVKKDMVVVFLSKSVKNNWSHLTTTEKKVKEPKPSLAPAADDGNPDPTAGLMNMMKKMYEEGDDDMKRTIAQSWTMSANKSKFGDGL